MAAPVGFRHEAAVIVRAFTGSQRLDAFEYLFFSHSTSILRPDNHVRAGGASRHLANVVLRHVDIEARKLGNRIVLGIAAGFLKGAGVVVFFQRPQSIHRPVQTAHFGRRQTWNLA